MCNNISEIEVLPSMDNDSKLQLLEVLFENTIIGLSVVDKSGKILLMNSKLEKLTGYKKGEILRQDEECIKIFVDPQVYFSLREKVLKDGDAERTVAQIAKKNGEVFWAG